MAKAEHARLTGPDVAKLRELSNRIQATKGLLEQAVVEKKEAQLIQALQEGRELGLSSILLEEGERTLQRIIERKNKRLLAKNQGSTPAMQAIALASAPFASSAAPSSQNASVVLEDAPSSATAPKLSLIQEVFSHPPFFCMSSFSVSIISLALRTAGECCGAAICPIHGFSLSSGEANRRRSCSARAGARPGSCCCRAGDAAFQCVACLSHRHDLCHRLLCVRPSSSAWHPSLSCSMSQPFVPTSAASLFSAGAPTRVRLHFWSSSPAKRLFECSMTCCVSWVIRWLCIQRCKRQLASLSLSGTVPHFDTSCPLSRLSNELLSQVSQQPLLRDELVMQLCSQLTNNPSAESAGRGWEFLEKVHLDFTIE